MKSHISDSKRALALEGWIYINPVVLLSIFIVCSREEQKARVNMFASALSLSVQKTLCSLPSPDVTGCSQQCVAVNNNITPHAVINKSLLSHGRQQSAKP